VISNARVNKTSFPTVQSTKRYIKQLTRGETYVSASLRASRDRHTTFDAEQADKAFCLAVKPDHEYV